MTAVSMKFLSLEPKRRDAIINAALKEFARKGFDDASTNVIARDAGISKGLVFHYIDNKQDFYQSLFDYCTGVLQEEYLNSINYGEKDILERLRQAFILKIELQDRYPWIYEFVRAAATAGPAGMGPGMAAQLRVLQDMSYESMFGDIDESMFRDGLDVERCKRIMFWSVAGFASQMIDCVVRSGEDRIDYDRLVAELDGYLGELRKSFYR